MPDQVRVRTIVDVAGLVAVVSSLIFVGLEVRQNTAATRSATMQQGFDGLRESGINVMSNERLRDLLVEVNADPTWLDSNAGTADYMLLELFALNRFNLWENSFFHLENGTLDPEVWIGINGWIESLAEDRLNHHFWDRSQGGYMPSFRRYIDSTFAEPRATSR